MKKSRSSDVRLVRCPRCREVLPEPTDVPFYRCGGCGATLQAEHYRKEIDTSQNNERVQSAHDGEPSCSSAQLVSTDQYSSGQNEGTNGGGAQNGGIEDLGVSSSNREVPSTNELKHQLPSSSVKHFQVLAQEGDDKLGDRSTIHEDLPRKELCTPSDERLSNLIPETGEVEGDQVKESDSASEVGSSQTTVGITGKKASLSDRKSNELDEKVNSSVVLEEEKTPGLDPSCKEEVITAPDLCGNEELHYSVASLNVAEAEELTSLAKKSQMTVETNLTEKVKQHQSTVEVSTWYRNSLKSPTRNSLAYDPSVSSCDTNNDQVKDRIRNTTMELTNKPEDKVFSADESSHSLEQGIPALLEEIRMSEALTDGQHRRNRRIVQKSEEFPSRVQHRRRFSGMSYEPIEEELYYHPTHYPPYRYRDVEPRTTRRQLNRSHVDERMFAERFWMGEELQIRNYHESLGEMYRHSRRPMYQPRRVRQTEYLPPVHNMARIPYSTEMRRDHHRVHESYSHLHPYDMRWSSEFPPPGIYRSRHGHIPGEPLDSSLASPQVFTDSEYYARRHDRIAEDQRISRLLLRRKSQQARHFQPIAGAAPFITCYSCFELLQLPPDFLPLKGVRIPRVKCSACSSILMFTIEKGCHLVPYLSKKVDIHESSTAASASQGNHDYEATLHGRSVSASVFAGSSQIRDSEKAPIRSSSEAPERQRSEAKGKSKMAETHNNTAATSPDIPRHSKVTWIMPARSTSPLHRLMGYSSPSAVLYGPGSGDLDT